MTVSDLITAAKAALQRGDHQMVRNLCLRVLQREPSNATANFLLGNSYYMTREFDKSLDPLVQGIKGGETMRFTLCRHRDLKPCEFGFLKLSATSIKFINKKALYDNMVTPDDVGDPDFDVPYAKILSAEPKPKGGIWQISMDVDVSKNKKVDKKDFDLRVPGSHGNTGYDPRICSNCTAEIGFIRDVIKSFSSNLK